MRQRLTVLFVALFVMAAILPAGAQHALPARPISKLEARHQPSATVTRRVLDQLAHVLHLQRYPSEGRPPPHLPLSDLWFWTTPYATQIAGLCAADEIIVNFYPARQMLAGADTPAMAHGITAYTRYRFIKLPDAPVPASLDWMGVVKSGPDCAKLKPDNDMLLAADDLEAAAEGVWLVTEIVRQAQLPAPSFAVDCSRVSQTLADTSCVKWLQGLTAANVSYVKTCELPPGSDVSLSCRYIFVEQRYGPLALTVYFKSDGSTYVIVKVTPAEVVTTADERDD